MLGLSLQIAGRFLVCDLMQVAAQMDEQGDGDAHNRQRTHAKSQEPPDHAHSATRIPECSGGYGALPVVYDAALRSATLWRMVSTRFVMNSRRFLPHLVRVTTCSMVRKNSGSSSFLRSSFTYGWIFA